MNCLIIGRHVDVYRRKGEFAGWPANYGLWVWGHEVACVFATGRLGRMSGNLHLEDPGHSFAPKQGRSMDGGQTWTVEPFNAHVPGGASLSADEHLEPRLKARNTLTPSRDLLDLETPIDFLDPETILLAARTGITGHPTSWFYASFDRARSWRGPFRFGGLDPRGGISARTDIVALGPHHGLFLLTTTMNNGEEGGVFCARTQKQQALRESYSGHGPRSCPKRPTLFCQRQNFNGTTEFRSLHGQPRVWGNGAACLPHARHFAASTRSAGSRLSLHTFSPLRGVRQDPSPMLTKKPDRDSP